MSEISDFLSNTVLVVEYQGGQIAWMEPRDLEFDEALRLFTSLDAHAAGLHPSERFFFPHYEEGPNSVFTYYAGRNAVFADRSCRFFLNGIRRDVWSALLTVDDGAELDDHDLDAPCVELRRVNLGNCFRLGLFLFLVVLPLPWVWLGRRPSQWARQPSDSEEPQ
jgi:hypothetical protein